MIIDKDRTMKTSFGLRDLRDGMSKIGISDISSSEDKIFSKTGKLIKIIVSEYLNYKL
jgi:hypothetical protein